jgi:hypothetical protein
MINRNSPLRPMVLVFILVNAFFIAGRNMLARWGADQDVVIIGNLVLFAVSLASFLMTRRSLNSSNPNAFVRAMYGSVMIRLFACAGIAFTYIMWAKKDVSKPALLICAGLYIVYTFIEVSSLTKLLREKKNA